MKIAFIGLGNMGSGMAANLVKAGHQVHGFDLSDAALERARMNGCMTFCAAGDAVEGVAAVVTMLPNGDILEALYHEMLFDRVQMDAILIDCSTIGVAAARTVAREAAEKGLVLVDAPVSGGIAAAETATLTFMVGGSEEGFARAQPVLQAMGKAVIHAGDSGAGQAA